MLFIGVPLGIQLGMVTSLRGFPLFLLGGLLGLVGLLLGLPKAILFAVIAAGFVLFSLFGWLIVVPLVALVFFTGPLRSLLRPAQRDQLNDFVVRVNALIEEQRKPGGYS